MAIVATPPASVHRTLALGPRPGRFDPDALRDLPEPVRRHLVAAIAPGTPLWSAALLDMRGSVHLGRWIPYHATELLAPHAGFWWGGRAAGVVSGHDLYANGHGELSWRLFGRVPVATAAGPDVDRGSAGRAMGEAVWLPTALLPDTGVAWRAEAEDHVVATFQLDDVPIDLHLQLDDAGLATEFLFRRWGDPTGGQDAGWHDFGGVATTHRTFGGLTIPAVGEVGWRPRGRVPQPFFRFDIRALRPITEEVAP